MDSNKIIYLIEAAIKKIDDYLEKYKDYQTIEQKDARKVLVLIKNDIEKSSIVRERLLRGYKDICTMTAIHYEETSYADSIFEVKEELENLYPKMKKLDLLRMDFGKGDPI